MLPGLFCILLFCGSCCGLGCNNNPYFQDVGPLVTTDTGSVIGKYEKVFDTDVAAFLGIPFAQPPLGEKRFAKPTPIEPWEGILHATKKPPKCMQYSSKNFSWVDNEETSENCLFLNVWVPTKCCCSTPSRLPVLVWIYGGGYYSGSTALDIYDGSTIAAYGNIIVVSMNYRVGSFGFLYTGQKDALGNAGLYDQNLALKWIQKNIPYFGGDASSITLYGESAGAWSISYHMVSPMSNNLFHRVIMQSGTGFHPFFVDNVQIATFKANTLAEVVGCKKDGDLNFTRIVQCLRKKDGMELAKAEDSILFRNLAFFFPTVGDEFLPVSPIEAFRSGNFHDVDAFLGNVANEFTVFFPDILPEIFDLNRKPVIKLADAKKILQQLFKAVPQLSVDKIADYYFKNVSEGNDEEVVRAISDSMSDYSFSCPAYFQAEEMQNVNFYWYTHRSLRDPTASWVGSTHFNDVFYLFGVPIHDTYNYTPEDGRFSGDLIRTLVAFSQKGHDFFPESVWPTFTKNEPWVYELNPRTNNKMMHPRKDACEFWRPYFV